MKNTIITVSGGVASVAEGTASIVDFDNVMAALIEDEENGTTGESLVSEQYDEIGAEYIRRTDPELWARICKVNSPA